MLHNGFKNKSTKQHIKPQVVQTFDSSTYDAILRVELRNSWHTRICIGRNGLILKPENTIEFWIQIPLLASVVYFHSSNETRRVLGRLMSIYGGFQFHLFALCALFPKVGYWDEASERIYWRKRIAKSLQRLWLPETSIFIANDSSATRSASLSGMLVHFQGNKGHHSPQTFASGAVG